MKFKTLITRYKNLGYQPKNVGDDEVELEFLINWIYKTYNIFLYIRHTDPNTQKAFKNHIPDIDSFSGHTIWDTNTKYATSFSYDKYFKEPYDAKFHTIKSIYSSIKFQFN